MNRQLLAPYALKWNPFAPDVPVEALLSTSRIESFSTRVEHLVREGGFAAALGPPGAGKSVALRLLQKRLSGMRDVVVGALTRPQCSVPDLYRELGELFHGSDHAAQSLGLRQGLAREVDRPSGERLLPAGAADRRGPGDAQRRLQRAAAA